MRESVATWLGMEFVELSAESVPGADVGAETRRLFADFEDALNRHDLSLAHTVRSRLFGRDRESRDAASIVRGDTLTGDARAATSSYIAPARFRGSGRVAMDLIALKPLGPGKKRIRENDPPRLPCRYLTWGSLVVLSGQTAVLPTLEEQVTTNILPRIGDYLEEAGSSWANIGQVSCYLHRDESPDHMRELYLRIAPELPPRFEIHFVEGYSAEGKRVEIETTAIATSG